MHCNTPILARDAALASAAVWAQTPEPVRASLRALHAAAEREQTARAHAVAVARSMPRAEKVPVFASRR